MSKLGQLFTSISRSPVVWGSGVSIGFHALIFSGKLKGKFIDDYCVGHEVEIAATTLFFVGTAALLFKLFDLLDDWPILSKPVLGEPSEERLPPEAAKGLLAKLGELKPREQGTALVRRLKDALQFVERQSSAEKLDDHLHYLADTEADRLHGSYAMLRIITWAIPILGFMGTVIGITMALLYISPEGLSDPKVLTQLTGGLSVAFNTTAQALGLTMVIMFGQFFVDRAESKIYGQVDQRTSELLGARFDQGAAAVTADPQVAITRRIAETVIKACEMLVHQQAEIWAETMQKSTTQWAESTERSGQVLQAAFQQGLRATMEDHVSQLIAAEEQLLEKGRAHWQGLQSALEDTAERLREQQSELSRQGQLLLNVVQATGQITQLEDALNRNLASLAGSQNFSETLVSLGAAIQLLSARMGQTGHAPHIELKRAAREGQAA